MSVLASRFTWTLIVPVAFLACSANNQSAEPDYEGVRAADEAKRDAMPPPPAAGNSQGWTQLAPAAGPVLNAGVAPDGVPEDAGNVVDVRMDAPVEAPPPPMTPETIISNNFYVSG